MAYMPAHEVGGPEQISHKSQVRQSNQPRNKVSTRMSHKLQEIRDPRATEKNPVYLPGRFRAQVSPDPWTNHTPKAPLQRKAFWAITLHASKIIWAIMLHASKINFYWTGHTPRTPLRRTRLALMTNSARLRRKPSWSGTLSLLFLPEFHRQGNDSLLFVPEISTKM